MARKDPLTYDVIGAAMQVHQRLGHGFYDFGRVEGRKKVRK